MKTFPAKFTTAEEFAEHLVKNKPYLIEIENEIQSYSKLFTEGKLKFEVHIRGGNVVLVDTWDYKRWKRNF